MQIRIPAYLSIVVMLLMMASCKPEKDNFKVNYGYEFAPTDTGHYVIYDVDSIFFNYVNPTQYRDTQHYQVKELIADTFYDNAGRLNVRLERYRRADASEEWGFDRVWYAYKSKTTFERIEDDLRFVKLVFPLTTTHWNGNNYISATDTTTFPYLVGWDYHYSSLASPFVIGTTTYDSTVTVSEVDEENLIDKKMSKLIYAKNVGMIYEEWEILNKQDVSSSWEYPNQVTGFRIRIRLNSYHP